MKFKPSDTNYRNSKVKSCSFSLLRFHPDAPAVAFNNALAHRQTYASTGILAASVQALENDENAIGILRIDANAVIADTEHPFALFPAGSDMNQRDILATKFDAVGEQILE